MSTYDKLDTINDSLNDIKAAIIAKGVTPTGNITTYATAVSQISGSTGKYQLLDRIKDDSNNEIGTVSGFFTDVNDTEYAVVCLDAQYRGTDKQYCSNNSQVTDLPIYFDSVSSYWGTAKETATFNTQKILDYCTANSYTSSACTECRSHSFTIDGTTYYGQLPNMKEMFDISLNFAALNTKDTSASSYTTTNFASSRNWWSSTQYSATRGWLFTSGGLINYFDKTLTRVVCPILEIPNS